MFSNNIFNKIRKSHDGKVLFQNFSYLAVLQIAGYIFPLITIPYLARVIGVDGFGKIAFASAIIVWFQTIADWGFNFTATRDVAKNRENKEKISEIFSNVLWARCFLVSVSFIILMIAILIIPYFKENQSIILVTFLLVPGQILFPDWFFQAMERMKYTTIINLLTKLLFTIAIFIFIKEKSDFILQPLFTSLGYVFSGLISMYYLLVKWKVKILAPSFKPIMKTIKESTDVFINNIVPNLYNSFSTVFLGFYSGSISNGILDAGSKFVNVLQQFMSIISRVFFPFLSRRIEKHNLFKILNFYTALIFSILLFLFAPIIVNLFFTTDFQQAIIVLRIMSFSIVFLSLSNIFGTNYLILIGEEKKLRNVTLVCSVVGLLSSVPLIILYDYIGAAISITLARAILGLTIRYQAINNRNIAIKSSVSELS